MNKRKLSLSSRAKKRGLLPFDIIYNTKEPETGKGWCSNNIRRNRSAYKPLFYSMLINSSFIRKCNQCTGDRPGQLCLSTGLKSCRKQSFLGFVFLWSSEKRAWLFITGFPPTPLQEFLSEGNADRKQARAILQACNPGSGKGDEPGKGCVQKWIGVGWGVM